jgi:hypothetical protein
MTCQLAPGETVQGNRIVASERLLPACGRLDLYFRRAPVLGVWLGADLVIRVR